MLALRQKTERDYFPCLKDSETILLPFPVVPQNMINELLQEQPRFATVRDYGNKLTREPCVGLEERMVLQERMQSLNEKWDDVYGKVTKRHDRWLAIGDL